MWLGLCGAPAAQAQVEASVASASLRPPPACRSARGLPNSGRGGRPRPGTGLGARGRPGVSSGVSGRWGPPGALASRRGGAAGSPRPCPRLAERPPGPPPNLSRGASPS